MPEIRLDLTAEDHAGLLSTSSREGCTPEAWAARALRRALTPHPQPHPDDAGRAEDEYAVSPGRMD